MNSLQCHQVDDNDIYIYTVERRRAAARQVLTPPPEIPAGFLAKWETALHPFADVAWRTDGNWTLHEDHRKDEIYTRTRDKYELGADFEGESYDGVGELPAWATNVPPPSHFCSLVDGVWVVDEAAELKDAKDIRIRYLSAACQAEIYAGFESNALGAVHHYPANDKDQQNLTASVLASLVPGLPEAWLTPFWCEVGGVWEFRMHTAAQIRQVGTDGKARILACMAQNDLLADEVRAATTKAAVEAIAWFTPE